MNALTTKPAAGGSLAPQNLTEAMRFADMLANSSMVPRDYQGKPANVLVAIQWGYEVGLGPLQAVQNIAVINGRPAIWGDAALALVRGHPACESVREGVEWDGDARRGWCAVKRRGEQEQIRYFTIADAKRAGLWDKAGPWKQYPDRMLQLRARGFAIRDVFPDALRGVVTREEAQDTPPEPREVKATVVDEPQAEAPQQPVKLPVLSPEGEIVAVVMDRWPFAVERALAKLESAAAVRKWREGMEPLLESIAEHMPKAAAGFPAAVEERLRELVAEESGEGGAPDAEHGK